MSTAPPPATRLALLFRVALTAALAEIVLVAMMTLRGAPADAPLYAGLLWVLLKSLPLLLVLPGLLRGRTNAAVWLCFISCFYFATAVLAAMDPSRRALGLLEIAVIATAFSAGLLAARGARQATSSVETS